MKLSKGKLATLIIILVIVADQVSKICVKTSFYYGEQIYITEWFRLYFIENNGMAYGMEIGSKLLLTLFRIVAVSLFVYYIAKICKLDTFKRGYIACLSLITAGAIGNVIDCVFYGVIFNNPPAPEVATFLSEGGGYAPLFYGRVVDMLYFPMVSWNWPEWVPFIGGDYYLFFSPIFNIADATLCVGVAILILFYTKSLAQSLDSKKSEDSIEEVN